MLEKNVCDSLIKTLLNIKETTKDDVNSRLDMIEMTIHITRLCSFLNSICSKVIDPQKLDEF